MRLPTWHLHNIVSDDVPFLKISRAVEGPYEIQKHGFGPRWKTPDEQSVALDSELKLVRLCANSRVRADLYLKFKNHQSPPHPNHETLIAGFDKVDEEMRGLILDRRFLPDHRPLRINGADPIDPMIVQERGEFACAVPNPVWINAPEEFAFWFMPGVEIPVSLEVLREKVQDGDYFHSKFSIRMSVSVPGNGQCGMFKFQRKPVELVDA